MIKIKKLTLVLIYNKNCILKFELDLISLDTLLKGLIQFDYSFGVLFLDSFKQKPSFKQN